MDMHPSIRQYTPYMLISITAIVINKNISGWILNFIIHTSIFIYHLYLFHTVPSPPLSVSLAVVPGSPNQLIATWTPPIPKNGIITAYTVYCNTSATQAYPEQVIGPNIPSVRSVVNGTTLSTILNTGLLPYTQYQCYVTANTSVGEGLPSLIVMNRTSESGKQHHRTSLYSFI